MSFIVTRTFKRPILFLSICLIALFLLYNYETTKYCSFESFTLTNESMVDSIPWNHPHNDNGTFESLLTGGMLRDLDMSIMDLYYSMQNSNATISQNSSDKFVHLLSISRQLFINQQKAGQAELSKLSGHIQRRLHSLQNPKNCTMARILICKTVYSLCGFGCIVHRISNCFTIAAAANRTMLFEYDGVEWAYGQGGWSSIFLPISHCKYNETIIHQNGTITLIPIFRELNQTDRVVLFPDNYTREFFAPMSHIPMVMPEKQAKFIANYHSNPPLWFLSQFIHFLWKFNVPSQRNIAEIERDAKIPTNMHPVIGIHVRRTDKINEVEYHSLDEYMKWVEIWYEMEEHRIGTILPRRLFISTDDHAVIEEANNHWAVRKGGAYEIYALEQNAKVASASSRYSDNSLNGLIAEINMLTRCNFVVCTFSSNICHLVYELMQALQGNAIKNVHSLDFYYDEWYNARMWPRIVTENYNVSTSLMEQVPASKGDIFEVNKVLLNGFVNGTNRRSGQKGLFPEYLLREEFRKANFSIFD